MGGCRSVPGVAYPQEGENLMAVPLYILLGFVAAGQPGEILLLPFDGPRIEAEQNDWGPVQPIELRGFRLTPKGQGCPANPEGRALDAGYTKPTREGNLLLRIAEQADFRQGTLEMWVKPAWATGARERHTFFHLKLRGGYWNAIWLGYHGTIGPSVEALGANIMDGIDHPAYVTNAKALGWRPGEWHHVAVTWTGHTEYLFLDGRLAATVLNKVPFLIGLTEGRVGIGCGVRGGPSAGALLDEFRLCNVPLYTPQQPPKPAKRIGRELGLGLATAGAGAKATASSYAPPEVIERDVPELHDGKYGQAVPVGGEGILPGRRAKGFVVVHLSKEADVNALEWSRDGTAYAGEGGRGWAALLPFPGDYAIAVSRDGKLWEEVKRVVDFRVTPRFVAAHKALRFREVFPPKRCKHVRLVVERMWWRHEARVLMDEVAVYATDGRNLATEPGASVATAMTTFERHHRPELAIDGRWGQESCWKSPTAGKGVLVVELPRAAQVKRVVFSTDRDGRVKHGVPAAGRVELSVDGKQWKRVGQIVGGDAGPRTVTFEPTLAKYLRVVIEATTDGREPVIDDLRVY